MPLFSEMRRDAVLATALGARNTGNLRVLNQKSVTASQASVMRPCLCQGNPSQNPRLMFSPFIRDTLPISRSGSILSRRVQCH